MSRAVVMAGWNDVPHISDAEKADLLKSIPAYQRDARTKGIPQLGKGAIYPIEESEIIVEPFEIPHHFPRAYALDVGWNKTAAIWGAYDRESDCWYLYSEHYRGHAEPSVHAKAIRARGKWIPGCIDPAARGRTQDDGTVLIDQYRENGLELYLAENALESGLLEVFERMSTGRLKIFSTLRNFFAEFRIYRRDENGKIVKSPDHLLDTARYLIMTGRDIMTNEPVNDDYQQDNQRRGRSKVGGY